MPETKTTIILAQPDFFYHHARRQGNQDGARDP